MRAKFVLITLIVILGGFYYSYARSKPREIAVSAPPSPSAILNNASPLASPTVTPAANTPKYLPGQDWHTVNHPDLGLSVCLPPKWEFAKYLDEKSNEHMSGLVNYIRDPGYIPNATEIRVYPYAGGSRRSEYFAELNRTEPYVQDLATIATTKELTINGKSFLDISIPGYAPVLVTVVGNKLVSVDRMYKEMVNDSASAFQKDIYTIAGCLK